MQEMNIYLDNQATTECDERVVEKMLPFFNKKYGNPHSEHLFGFSALEALDQARTEVASLIGARPDEIIFTSGATEANNLAIKGVANFYNNKKRIVTTKIEHKCILNSCKRLEKSGIHTDYMPVESNGILSDSTIEKYITDDVLLASVIFANNEIGTIQPIEKVAQICAKHNVIFHTDAVQAIGKVGIDVHNLGIDLMSISSHKIYGPKGVGALYRRVKGRRVNLSPIIDGGGQEFGIRSGTVPVALCVGLGEACRIAGLEIIENREKIKHLQDVFLNKLLSNLTGVHLNGDKDVRIFGNLNLSFEGVESEALIFGLKTIAVSSGSACTSNTLEPSYVLKAIGVPDELINTSIRVSIGKFNTLEEIEVAVDTIVKTVNKLRQISAII